MTSRLAVVLGQAVGAQVEELLGIDLGDGGGVGAAHVVGLDLQAGDGVGVGALGEEQVARLLEGVGLLRAGVDDDVALPHRARAALQHPAEGEVRGGVGRGVLLGGVEVDVLAAVGGVGAGDAGVGALAGQAGLHQHVPRARAEAERDPVEAPVAADRAALRAEDPAALRQVLTADVAQVGVVADHELGGDVEDAVEVLGRRRGTAPRPRPARPPRARCASLLVDERSALGLHGRSEIGCSSTTLRPTVTVVTSASTVEPTRPPAGRRRQATTARRHRRHARPRPARRPRGRGPRGR